MARWQLVRRTLHLEDAQDAQTLASTFADVERFWVQVNKPDAVTSAREPRLGASEAAAAAAIGDATKTAAARSKMTATCQHCHGLYRQGDADSSYRIKAGGL